MSGARSLLRLIRPRSNGIAIDRGTARAIRRADAARGRGDWQQAVTAYTAALRISPHLAHIWVQLGHARKEAGAIEAAQADYARAAALAPTDADPWVHLGLTAKLLGRTEEANRHYLAALARSSSDLSTVIDALRTAPAAGPEREAVMAHVASMLELEASAPSTCQWAVRSRALCIDISDLLAYFGRGRLPTGIQRVQIEIVMAIGRHEAELATICCYSSLRRGWTAIDADSFVALARMALASDDRQDPAWRRAVATAHLTLARAPLLQFAEGAVLLNLGTSWSERNYFLDVRIAREETRIAYVPMVYDCIPMFAPQWFPTALARDYRAWMNGLFEAADGLIAISHATRSDLLRIADDLGSMIASNSIGVVTMDGDFTRADRPPSGDERLAAWKLAPNDYVLMVSTIEPRKNHVGAFEAWLDLIANYGPTRIPTLVCVGGSGWLNDAVHDKLRRHRALRNKVLLLSGIADADLDLLYRCALFTLYPSFYEGWGLPVTESLCHGRVPAISNTSSLPEAGGSFAVYFDPHDHATIARSIAPLILDDAHRKSAENHIRKCFVPRSWHEIAMALAAETSRLAAQPAPPRRMAQAEPDVRYVFGSETVSDASARSGEAFRTGSGWAEPEARGNPVGRIASMLRMAIPAGDWTLRLDFAGKGGETCRITSAETQLRVTLDRSDGTARAAIPFALDRTDTVELLVSAEQTMLLTALTIVARQA